MLLIHDVVSEIHYIAKYKISNYTRASYLRSVHRAIDWLYLEQGIGKPLFDGSNPANAITPFQSCDYSPVWPTNQVATLPK